jgi:hypothetical protein
MESLQKKLTFYKERISNYEKEIFRISSILCTPNMDKETFFKYVSEIHNHRININICREQIAKIKYYKSNK